MKRNSTPFLVAIILVMGLANGLFAQSKRSPYEIIINGNGFTSLDGKNYISIKISLNNNTNEILYYQGTDCYNLLFDLKPNSYFHLAKDMCKNNSNSKTALPPHRSQKMQVLLSLDKELDKNILISLHMKLREWAGNKVAKQMNDDLSGKLSDTIVLHYNSNHHPFWPSEEFTIIKNREKLILPDKDIYLLTDSDRNLYKLTVNNEQTTKPRDTVIRVFKNNISRRANVVTVPVSVHNNSNEALRFYSMTCSWFEFWDTDNRAIELSTWGCQYNIPEIITVAPHQEYKKKLDVIYDSTVKGGTKYRIVMSLLKAPGDGKANWDFWPGEYTRFNKIWSNKITIR